VRSVAYLCEFDSSRQAWTGEAGPSEAPGREKSSRNPERRDPSPRHVGRREAGTEPLGRAAWVLRIPSPGIDPRTAGPSAAGAASLWSSPPEGPRRRGLPPFDNRRRWASWPWSPKTKASSPPAITHPKGATGRAMNRRYRSRERQVSPYSFPVRTFHSLPAKWSITLLGKLHRPLGCLDGFWLLLFGYPGRRARRSRPPQSGTATNGPRDPHWGPFPLSRV
jgi:hypothetical protein